MGATPICTVDQTGIHRPALGDVLTYFTQGYQSIYGADTYLGSDSQDGELLGLLASAVDDANAMAVAAYNAFSPATAQGAGLSSVVKINGIAREVPSNSTIPLLVVGVFGTPIPAGVVTDPGGDQWELTNNILIPSEGQIVVTATCLTIGAITPPSGAWKINTQTRGWQTVAPDSAPTPGQPVEQDAPLRIRQSKSTMLPSNTMLEGILGAVAAIPGVVRLRGYENDTNTPDGNGIPGHSIALVVDGGDAQTICNTIAAQKFACGTYGTTTETVVDAYGIPHPINYFAVTEPNITWALTITPLTGFSANTLPLIQASLAAWTNALGIGVGIQINRAYAAAYLSTSLSAAASALQAAVAGGDPQAIAAATAAFTAINTATNTYEITALAVARDAGSPTSADVSIAFNEAPLCVASGVTITS